MKDDLKAAVEALGLFAIGVLVVVASCTALMLGAQALRLVWKALFA